MFQFSLASADSESVTELPVQKVPMNKRNRNVVVDDFEFAGWTLIKAA